MRPGVWTSFYYDLSPEDAFEHLADLGWKDLEVSAEHGDMATQNEDWRERLVSLRKLCEDRGVTLWQMHSPLGLKMADPDPKTREEDINTAAKWIEYSSYLGIPHLVIHPGGSAKKSELAERKGEVFALNLDSFSRLAEVGSKFGVKLCIENMMDRVEGDIWRFGSRISEINELIDTANSEALAICFDSSHANVTGLNMSEAIHECGDRLKATHFSDNDGSGDQHKLPFNGKIDWRSVVSALKDTGYSCLFNLEIPGENKEPLLIRDARLRYAKELLDYIIENF